MTVRNPRPVLLGHRGVRPLPFLGVRWRKPAFPPENTLAAFEYAMAQGCDGFEFDVRYTRDRRSVLCHDREVKGSDVSASDYVALERRCGYPIPSLEEVLARFATSAWLDIEIKVTGEEEAVVAALRKHRPQNGYVVSSFLPDVLVKLHELDSSLSLGYICERRDDALLWSGLPINVFLPHHSLVLPELVAEAHRRKVGLMTWTVNRREDLLRLAGWGVDGLISDDPKLLAETFPRAKAAAAAG